MIGLHSSGGFVTTGSGTVLLKNILMQIFGLCNALYFVLSGKFALSSRFETKEDIFYYYKNKAIKLMVPIVIMMFIRTLYDFRHELGPHIFSAFCENIWGTYSSTEYWFLYALVGNILLAPFIGKALQSLDDSAFLILIGIGFIFNTLSSIGATINAAFTWTFPLMSWSIFFYLGYGIEKIINTNRYRLLSYALALASVFIIVFTLEKNIYLANIGDLSPLYFFEICGAYIFLSRIYTKSHGKLLDNIVRVSGKYSFPAYMFHMPILERVCKYIPYQHGGWFLWVIVTFVISLLAGFLLNLIILNPVTSLLSKKFLVRKAETGNNAKSQA